MRRIICLISVVLILCACAIPAFALGANPLTAQKYSALPFQYMYFNRLGGPFEYPSAQTRTGSYVEVNYDCQSVSGSPEFDLHLSSQADYLDANFFFPYDIHAITLEMRDGLARINDASIQLAAYDGDVIWSIRIYGNYKVPSYSSDGNVVFTSYQFDQQFIEQTSTLELKTYLLAVFQGKTRFNFDEQYFGYLCIDIELEPVANSTVNHFEIYTRSSALTYTAPNLTNWITSSIGSAPNVPDVPDQPDIPVNFEVGTFLGNSVSSFMTTPIWGDFTFGHLFGIALTLGVLFFALKLLV